MATDFEYIQYVLERVTGTGDTRFKKMFGEYMVYVDDKPILLVCDNTVFVKILPELKEIMQGAEVGYPYDGAKQHYILDIDNAELTSAAISALVAVTPPKKKKCKHEQLR